jgi:hypothetical protein
MNDEQERMSREAVVAEFKVFRLLPGGTEETHENFSHYDRSTD